MKKDWVLLARYLIVGCLNTAFGYASYATFIGAEAPLWLAVSGTTILSFIFNFYSYGGMVFGSTSYRVLPRFLVFYCMLGILNYLLLRGLVWSGYGPFLAQALLLPILAAVGFFGMRRFVF